MSARYAGENTPVSIHGLVFDESKGEEGREEQKMRSEMSSTEFRAA
jgi:hypothetical protein